MFGKRLATCAGNCQGLCRRDRQGRGRGADRFGESYNLLHSLALHAQGDQQSRNLGVGTLPRKHFRHDVASFGAIQRFTVIGQPMQRVEDHGSGEIVSDANRISVLKCQLEFSIDSSGVAPDCRFRK